MCGIAGYISSNGCDAQVLKKMTDRIAHRGPDGEGFYLDDICALGHRRLAIIDLNTGDQPIYNEDRSIVVVFNGEIYNFQSLREELKAAGHHFKTQTDTEVLVHGYEEWGTDLTSRLRGMYGFAIWDTVKKQLYLARDKWGIKPLYYYATPTGLLFASEIKAFLDHPEFHKELNEEILAAYLCFNSTPTEETFFKNVFRLEPGHQMILHLKEDEEAAGQSRPSDAGQSKQQDRPYSIRMEEFFRLDLDEGGRREGITKPYDPEETAEKIGIAMEDSVKAHGFADVEIGGFLSSGIDSSYLVSLAKPAKTFTVGYADPRYDEIAYAKDLSEKLGIENYSRQITKEEYIKAFPNIQYHMDEPLADPAAIALYFVAEKASEYVKVVTSGEGADELFGGYLSYREEIDQGWYMKIPYPVRKAASFAAGLLPEFPGRNFVYRRGRTLEEEYIGLGRVFSDKEARALVKNKNQIQTREITAPYYAGVGAAMKNVKEENGATADPAKGRRAKGFAASSMEKRQIIDYYFWLVKDFLHAVDRNTMMFGLEARTPFLDDKVYEAARTLPKAAKINTETTKPALRLAASKVIPNEAYKKKKLGFPVPLRAWMKEADLFAEIQKKFQSDAAKQLFDIQKLNKLLAALISGKQDCYKKVWTIYTFLVWYDQFFAGENG